MPCELVCQTTNVVSFPSLLLWMCFSNLFGQLHEVLHKVFDVLLMEEYIALHFSQSCRNLSAEVLCSYFDGFFESLAMVASIYSQACYLS